MRFYVEFSIILIISLNNFFYNNVILLVLLRRIRIDITFCFVIEKVKNDLLQLVTISIHIILIKI